MTTLLYRIHPTEQLCFVPAVLGVGFGFAAVVSALREIAASPLSHDDSAEFIDGTPLRIAALGAWPAPVRQLHRQRPPPPLPPATTAPLVFIAPVTGAAVVGAYFWVMMMMMTMVMMLCGWRS